ncbi:MAG: hypothetical protein AABX73_01915 [Nanoarchaeota archaeon]
MLIKNKKADVPITLVLIVAFALSIIALISFATFNSELTTQSQDLSDMLFEINLAHDYIAEKAKLISEEAINSCPACDNIDLKESFKSSAETQNFKISNIGNFFGKIRNNEFQFEQLDNTYTLKIENIILQSERNDNKISREFSICMEFNKNGKYSKNC